MNRHKFIGALIFWEKIFLFLIALGIVAFMYLSLNVWSDEFKEYFLYMGNIESYIYLTVFIFGVTFIMRWLLIKVWKLEFRQEIRQAKQRRRRR